jgi:hypothetical protein
MTHVATLIAASGALSPSAVESARGALPAAGTPQWLGPDAADIPFSAERAADQRALAKHT